MAVLKKGDRAPHFILKNQDGEKVTFPKKKIVLYFYPKASTPFCTEQARQFRDQKIEFDKRKVLVLGVSPDLPEKLLKFKNKYDLNFDLLSDPDHKVSIEYGVWELKKMFGMKYMGILRTTFIIAENGLVEHVLNKVKIRTHCKDVLSLLSSNDHL